MFSPRRFPRVCMLVCLLLALSTMPVFANEDLKLDGECVIRETEKRFDDRKITPAEQQEINRICAIGGDGGQVKDPPNGQQNAEQPQPENNKSQEQQDAESYTGHNDGRIPGQHPECNIYARGDRVDVVDEKGKLLFKVTNREINEVLDNKNLELGVSQFSLGVNTNTANTHRIEAAIEVTVFGSELAVPIRALAIIIRCTDLRSGKTRTTRMDNLSGLGQATFDSSIAAGAKE